MKQNPSQMVLGESTERPTRPRGRPLKGSGTSNARELILDVSEALFSRHGLDGVSMRDVAQEAHVDTALLHYYFGTKRGLFDAVFERRADSLNDDRLASLNAYADQAGGDITVEGALEAFLQPMLERGETGGPGWKNYLALIAQANANPIWGAEAMGRFFDPVIRRLIELLRIALPQASDEDLYWAYHNFSGAVTLTMGQIGRIDRLSNGLCRSSDLKTAYAKTVTFASAGFRALSAASRA